MRRLSLFALSLLLVSCQDRQDTNGADPEPTGSVAVEAPTDCAADLARLTKRIAAMRAEGSSSHRPDGFEGVNLGQPPSPILSGPMLVLGTKAGRFDGMLVSVGKDGLSPGGELVDLLRAKGKRYQRLTGKATIPAVMVQIDGRMRWELVATLLTTMAGLPIDRVQLVFDAKSELKAPPTTPLRGVIDRWKTASNRLDVVLSPPHRDSPLRRCKAKVSFDFNHSLGDNLDELVAVLPRCGCGRVDLAQIEEWVWCALSRHLGPPHQGVTLTLAKPPTAGQTVSRPAAEPWATASQAMVAAAEGQKPLTIKVTSAKVAP
jgi:hypothetical protein